MAGRARPCFLIGRSHLILPAFGHYTGGLSHDRPALRALVPEGVAVLTGRLRAGLKALGLSAASEDLSPIVSVKAPDGERALAVLNAAGVIEQVEDLDATDRGEGGFGSSGK